MGPEIDMLDPKYKNPTVNDLINSFIYVSEQTKGKTSELYFSSDNHLMFGNGKSIKVKNRAEASSQEELVDFLVNNKRRQFKLSMWNENGAYRKYVLDNKIISTDGTINGPLFQNTRKRTKRGDMTGKRIQLYMDPVTNEAPVQMDESGQVSTMFSLANIPGAKPVKKPAPSSLKPNGGLSSNNSQFEYYESTTMEVTVNRKTKDDKPSVNKDSSDVFKVVMSRVNSAGNMEISKPMTQSFSTFEEASVYAEKFISKDKDNISKAKKGVGRQSRNKVYVKAYDNLRNKSESELKSILKARNKSARSGAQSSPISVAESYIARQILDGKTKELDADYAKPEESNQQTSEVKPTGSINVYWGQSESNTSTKVLSNLAPRKFTYAGNEYGSVEHAYQTLKSGEFDQSTYTKYVELGGYGKKIRGKGTINELKAADSLGLMKKLVVESFKQNANSEAAKKLMQYKNFTHNTNQLIDQAFLAGLKLAQEELSKPTEQNVEVDSAYDILENTGLDFLPGSLEILVKRLGERGISEQDVANALLDARTNTVYDLGEILHANKINQPKQGEVLDLSDATLGEKKKVKAFDEALSNLKITQDSDFVKAPIEGISDAAIAEMSNENYRELVETGYTQWYGKTGEAEEAATYVKNTYKVGDTQISANENNDVSSPPKGSPVSQSFLQFPSDEEMDDVDNFDDVDFEDVNMGFDPSEDLSKQDDGKPETKCKK